MDTPYSEAVAILTKRFGNQQQIVTKHMDALMGLEAVTSNHNLKDLVDSHTRSLHSLGIHLEFHHLRTGIYCRQSS